MPEETSSELERDENGRLKPGQRSLNPEGRPNGAISFATKWRIFIEKVAEETNRKPEDIDEGMWRVALDKAMEGDYQFYKDIHDRLYGRPNTPITGADGGAIQIQIDQQSQTLLKSLEHEETYDQNMAEDVEQSQGGGSAELDHPESKT